MGEGLDVGGPSIEWRLTRSCRISSEIQRKNPKFHSLINANIPISGSQSGEPLDSRSLRRPLIIFTAMMTMVPILMIADEAIRDFVQVMLAPGVQGMMQNLTLLGEIRLLLPFSLGLWGWGALRGQERLKSTGFLGFVTIAFTSVTVQALKHLFGRARPTLEDSASFWKGPSLEAGYDAFPSAHAAAAFSLAVILSSVYPRWSSFWYLAALMVAITRIFLDVHFASDVVAGGAVGFLLSKIVIRLVERRGTADSG